MFKLIKRLRTDFLAGMALILPVIATILIIRFLVITTNNIILEPLRMMLEPRLKASSLALARSLIFVGVILTILIVGEGARLLVLRKVFGFGERFLYRVPLINRIYRSLKQIITALFESKSIFKDVALVEYPRKGIYSIGFITTKTKEGVEKKTGKSTMNVFIPTTPNPTSGMLVMVPKEDIILLDISIEDGMKLVVSGGAVAPGELPRKKTE